MEAELRHGGGNGAGLNTENLAGGAFAVEAEDLRDVHDLTKCDTQVRSLQVIVSKFTRTSWCPSLKWLFLKW